MRTPIIAGNWKMHKTIGESVSLIKELKALVKDVEDREIVVCPPFTALSAVGAEIKASNIELGAQNMFYEKEGAFTGEISALMLKEIGCRYIIIGHSERRQYFNETNEMINKKIRLALKLGLSPILCIGETLKQREKNVTQNVVGDHIRNGLKSLTEKNMKNIVIAYEPVWAIGTGKNATAEQAEDVHVFVRDLLKKIFSKKTASNTRILYGGSVNPDNIKELMVKENIDGALVGGASLDALKFSMIVKY